MLILLVMAVLVEAHQKGNYRQILRSLTSKSERDYGDATMDWIAATMLTVYRVGILSMMLYIVFFHSPYSQFYTYLAIMGIVVLVFAIKMLLSWLCSYTFSQLRRFVSAAQQMDNIITVVCLALYPVTLLAINYEGGLWLYLLIGAIALGYVVLVVYKLVMIFMVKPLSVFYIILYFLTLEVLPWSIIIFAVIELTHISL